MEIWRCTFRDGEFVYIFISFLAIKTLFFSILSDRIQREGGRMFEVLALQVDV